MKLTATCRGIEMKTTTRNSRRRILQKSQGVITIFEMIPFCGIFFGILLGIKIGSHFGGIAGGFGGFLIGAVVGGIFGRIVGRLTLMGTVKLLHRDFSKKTVEELRTMLHDPNCLAPNVLILELGKRGEKTDQELPVVLDLLRSPLRDRRIRGWYALASVFPERAKIISDYRIDDSVEKCKEKIRKILPIQK
jgi:hypothetical protein